MEKKRKVENTWYCAFVLNMTIFTSGILFAYAITYINPLIPILNRIYNETYYKRYGEEMPLDTWNMLLSWSTSIALIGGFFGGIAVTFILNYITRKQVLILLHILSVIGYVIQAIGLGLWGSYEALLVGRLVGGFPLGMALSMLPLIIGEISVPNKRPLYGNLLAIGFALGAVIGPLIAWSEVLGSDELWIGVLLFGMLPSIIFLASAYWVPETPYQILLKNGSQDEAIKTVKKLRTGDKDEIELEIKMLLNQIKNVVKSENSKAEIATLTEILKTPQYRRHFFGVVVLFSYLMVCGVNNILFFSTQIFLNAGLEPEVGTPATIGAMVLFLLIIMTGLYTNDRIEQKKLLLAGTAIMIIGDICMTTSMATYEFVPAMSVFAVVAMCIFLVGFGIVNSVIFVIIGAITIERTRPVCSIIGSSSHLFCSWFVGFISTYLQIWLGPYAFMVWMVVTILVGLYIIFCIPNIFGKTSDDIQEYFKGKDFKFKLGNRSDNDTSVL